MELWHVRKGLRVMRCTTRTISFAEGTWDEWTRQELRIERDGEIYLTETYQNLQTLGDRSLEMLRALLASGWSDATPAS